MEFFSGGSSEEFEGVLQLYPEAVKAKALLKNKKKGESLQVLDKWMQDELQRTADTRTPPHITRQELVRLMDWKLSRGKFRPRLIELAGSNEEQEVVKVTTKGLSLAAKGKIEPAIQAIAVLRGVGPATASAILAACRPKFFCFFADEVGHVCLPGQALKYTAKEYVAVNEAVTLCADRLNEKDENRPWTPHRVELAVWSYCVLEKCNPDLLHTTTTTSSPPKKRKTANSSSSSSSSPPKKRKTANSSSSPPKKRKTANSTSSSSSAAKRRR